jgi:tetratricopeptide (TPR) repeat protein
MGIGQKISVLLAKIFTRRKLLEYGLGVLLLACGLTAYLLIWEKGRGSNISFSPPEDLSDTRGQLDLRDRTFINALYHYRLENYDRARILFNRALESSHSRKKKSTALLYLGNISYKKGVAGFESDEQNGFETALSFYEDALALDKNNHAVLHNISLVLMRLGRDNEALSYARRLYTMRKTGPHDLLLFGNLLFMYGRYPEAATVFSEGAQRFAVYTALFSYNHAIALLYSGDVSRASELFEEIFKNEKGSLGLTGLSAYQLGYILKDTEIDKAEELLSEAYRIFSSSDELAFDLALVLLKQDIYGKAVFLLETAKNGMDEKRRRELLGYALFKRGMYADALKLFAAVGQMGKQTPEECYILGDLYMKAAEPDVARRYYECALAEGAYGGAFVNLVRLLQEEGELQAAKELCERYTKASPGDSVPGILLADVLFYLGDRGEAMKLLEKAGALSHAGGDVLREIAAVYRRHGYYNNALLIYHRALDSSPYDEILLFRIASLYLITGHKERAKGLLDQARTHMEDLSEYYDVTLLSAVCSDPARAEVLYRELILDFPYRYESYYNLSLLLLESERYEESAKTVHACLKDAVDIQPAVGSKLYMVLGYIHAEQEEWDEARRQYANAIRLDPMNETALLNLRILDSRGM